MDHDKPAAETTAHTEVTFSVGGPSNPAPAYASSYPAPAHHPAAPAQAEPEDEGPPPFVPLTLRPLQVVFAIATFAVMASASYGDSVSDPATGNYFCTGSKICSGKHFYDYSSYAFLVAAGVLAFVWALVMLCLDVCKVGRRPGGRTRTCMPRYAYFGDTFIVFILFGACCAASALTTGLNELQPGFCNYLSNSFCMKVTAAPVLGFLTWLLYLPSFVLNVLQINSEGPW